MKRSIWIGLVMLPMGAHAAFEYVPDTPSDASSSQPKRNVEASGKSSVYASPFPVEGANASPFPVEGAKPSVEKPVASPSIVHHDDGSVTSNVSWKLAKERVDAEKKKNINMVWRLEQGKTIRENLENWVKIANEGGHVVWDSPYDYTVKHSVTFTGMFDLALRDLFNTTMKFDRPLYGVYWKRNHVVQVSDHWEEKAE